MARPFLMLSHLGAFALPEHVSEPTCQPSFEFWLLPLKPSPWQAAQDSSEFSPQHSCRPLVLSPGTWGLEGAVGQGHYKCGQWGQVQWCHS